jgi:hypothetical protein
VGWRPLLHEPQLFFTFWDRIRYVIMASYCCLPTAADDLIYWLLLLHANTPSQLVSWSLGLESNQPHWLLTIVKAFNKSNKKNLCSRDLIQKLVVAHPVKNPSSSFVWIVSSSWLKPGFLCNIKIQNMYINMYQKSLKYVGTYVILTKYVI